MARNNLLIQRPQTTCEQHIWMDIEGYPSKHQLYELSFQFSYKKDAYT